MTLGAGICKYRANGGTDGKSAEKCEKREAVPDYQVMILRKPDVAVYWDKIINGISEEASRNHCRTQVAVVTEEEEAGQQLPPGLNESIQAVFFVKLMDRDYIGK